MRSALGGLGGSTDKMAKEGVQATSALAGSLGSLKQVAAGLGVTFGALAIGQTIRNYAEAAMDFQREWMRVSVILRDTPAAQVNELKRQILDMDPALGTAKEKTAALYETISAGITEPRKAMEFMRQAAIAASGGMTEMATTVNAGTTLVLAFANQGLTARHAFDGLARSVDIGKFTFGQIASVIGGSAATAVAAGVSFDEMMGTVARLSLVMGTIPAAVAGYLFEQPIEDSLRATWIVGVMLIGVGVVMWGVDRRGALILRVVAVRNHQRHERTGLRRLGTRCFRRRKNGLGNLIEECNVFRREFADACARREVRARPRSHG